MSTIYIKIYKKWHTVSIFLIESVADLTDIDRLLTVFQSLLQLHLLTGLFLHPRSADCLVAR